MFDLRHRVICFRALVFRILVLFRSTKEWTVVSWQLRKEAIISWQFKWRDMNQIPERKCLFAVWKKTKESCFVLVVCLFVFLFFFCSSRKESVGLALNSLFWAPLSYPTCRVVFWDCFAVLF
jgi:hypothetical protein